VQRTGEATCVVIKCGEGLPREAGPGLFSRSVGSDGRIGAVVHACGHDSAAGPGEAASACAARKRNLCAFGRSGRVWMLERGEDMIVARRLREVLTSAG
jgi:hypothetical protein